MFSKTLIVCLLAFFCLNVAIAERLNTRIAGQFISERGQFPYIAFISYNYLNGGNLTTHIGTGVIYSSNSVVTTASTFKDFPAAGTVVTISVGAYDYNSALQAVQFNATIARYNVPANGTTPPAAPADLIVIPQQYVAGQSTFDIAAIRLPTGSNFNFTSAEVAIGNFPTSSPLPSDPLFAVAYGNQNPGGETFPALKFTQMYLKKANKCQANLTSAGVNRLNRTQHFCVQSKAIAQTNNTFEGVCRLDIGGALVRSSDIKKPNEYYEVIGLVSFADDSLTCDSVKRVPAIIIYLSYFQEGFFTPILGSLASAGNKQDPAKNPDSGKGNFICGNGVVEKPFETCDPATAAAAAAQPCCNVNTCAFKRPGSLCEAKTGPKNICLTRSICDPEGTCAKRPRDQGKRCNGKGSSCVNGTCVSA